MKILFISIILSLILSLTLISGVSAVGTYPAVSNDIKLYYHFNNDSNVGEGYTLANSFVYDYSGNNNNGTTFGNITWNNSLGYLGDGVFKFNESQVINTTLNMTGWNKYTQHLLNL